jgi:TPR repeat protein
MSQSTPLVPVARVRAEHGRPPSGSLANLYESVRAVQDETVPFLAPRMIAAFCFGLVVALGLQQWLARTKMGAPRTANLFATDGPPVIPMPRTAQQGGSAGREQSNKLTLDMLVQAEARSPFGRSSAGVSTDAALALADAHLRGVDGAPRSRLEAGYWLRHALSPTFRDTRVPWALTQLGSIYATPDAGLADFKSASLIWQIAGSMGDPVATCYLARMHEFGIGMEKDTETARRVYGIAQKAGGCPGLAEALARLP